MKIKTYERAIDAERKRSTKAFKAIAAQIRKDVIVPMCARFGMSFFGSSNSFYKDGVPVSARPGGSYLWLPVAARSDLRVITELLDYEVWYETSIGHMIEDVRI